MSEVLIYLFGCSHCKCFIHDRANGGVLHHDNVTLYNKFKKSASARGLTNPKSTLGYKEDINHTLEHVNLSKSTHNICVMKFGQVDIEYNYYYKIYGKNESINKNDFYIDTINEYVAFVKNLKQSFPNIRFIVNGVNMPNIYDLQKYMKNTSRPVSMPKIEYKDHFDDHYLFNTILQDKCETENIEYFDLTSETTENRCIKPEFIGSDNHLAGGDKPNFKVHDVFLNKLFKVINKDG